MYKVIHNSGKYTEFQTKDDAQAFLDSKGRAKCFFKIEKVEEPKQTYLQKQKLLGRILLYLMMLFKLQEIMLRISMVNQDILK